MANLRVQDYVVIKEKAHSNEFISFSKIAGSRRCDDIQSHSKGLISSCRIKKTISSKACKTPLNFLTVKLLPHIQIKWKH